MKACLSKVNYDPRFTAPHNHPNKPFESLQARLNATRGIYQQSSNPVPYQIHRLDRKPSEIKRSKDLKMQSSSSKLLADNASSSSSQCSKDTKSSVSPPTSMAPLKDKSRGPSPMKAKGDILLERTREDPTKSQNAMKLKPLRSDEKVTYSPYMDKLPRQRTSSQFQTSVNIYANQRRSFGNPVKTALDHSMRTGSQLSFSGSTYQRSRTAPDPYNVCKGIKTPSMLEMERRAKAQAERAMKCRKVFTILGPYPSLRMALRRRGWVEKFANAPSPSEVMKKQKSADDDDVLDSKENRAPPWEEENGFYGTMSYMVRNCTPTFVFTVKSNDVDSRVTKGSQLVNHFGKARNFTTKAGLVQNLRHLHWFNSTDPDSMYPRSYKLDELEEREAFIDDYRVTACISIVRYFVQKYHDSTESGEAVDSGNPPEGSEKKPDKEVMRCYYQPISQPQMISDISINMQVAPTVVKTVRTPKKKAHPEVSIKALELAVQQCERLLQEKIHQDIDLFNEPLLTTSQWNQMLSWFYEFVHEDGAMSPVSEVMVNQCQELLRKIEDVCPQYILDGFKNAWILKPGAKSRGRGIQCLDKLESIQTLLDNADCCMIAQKYIEQPFLVHNTKFDIRQWFLVTDWNPLTIWFYKHCYLRFCSQEFTLDDFHSSIHLSNNSIQKHYTPAGVRCDKLPDDNMWTSDEFVSYLRSIGREGPWFEVTVPGMKQAIVSTLLCTQEHIESRKSAFELYGADFMMTEDMHPWLIEVNSSPSMAQTTRATAKLVEMVLEDTVRVVLDRREDKHADTGCFELIYKQQYINDPLPTDPGLAIHGRKVSRPYHKR